MGLSSLPPKPVLSWGRLKHIRGSPALSGLTAWFCLLAVFFFSFTEVKFAEHTVSRLHVSDSGTPVCSLDSKLARHPVKPKLVSPHVPPPAPGFGWLPWAVCAAGVPPTVWVTRVRIPRHTGGLSPVRFYLCCDIRVPVSAWMQVAAPQGQGLSSKRRSPPHGLPGLGRAPPRPHTLPSGALWSPAAPRLSAGDPARQCLEAACHWACLRGAAGLCSQAGSDLVGLAATRAAPVGGFHLGSPVSRTGEECGGPRLAGAGTPLQRVKGKELGAGRPLGEGGGDRVAAVGSEFQAEQGVCAQSLGQGRCLVRLRHRWEGPQRLRWGRGEPGCSQGILGAGAEMRSWEGRGILEDPWVGLLSVRRVGAGR